jgi:hypothetical protein
MREGLDAPTLALPEGTLGEVRTFLDGQSRIELAVWVRHEHEVLDGRVDHDHHIVLAVADEDWETGDMRALETGIWKRLPLRTRLRTWIDLAPASEVEELRRFGTVLWEQTLPGGDPLDYRYTSEPFEPDPESVVRFRALLAELPAVRCVGGDLERLWNGDDEVQAQVRLAVEAPFEADALPAVVAAARETVLVDERDFGSSIGELAGSMTVLYQAGA